MTKKVSKEVKVICNCDKSTMKYLSDTWDKLSEMFYCKKHDQIKVVQKQITNPTIRKIREGM